MSKTKILFLTVVISAIALSGCNSFNSEEGQTSVVTFEDNFVGEYEIKTVFPAHATNPGVTMRHNDAGDGIEIGYEVSDVVGPNGGPADGIVDINDCKTLEVYVNTSKLTTRYTGLDAAENGSNIIWIKYDGGGCVNTTHTINQSGQPLAMKLEGEDVEIEYDSSKVSIQERGYLGTPDPATRWELLEGVTSSGTVKLISQYGICGDGAEWDDTAKTCTSLTTPVEPVDENPSEVLNQSIVCYHKVYGTSEFAGEYVKCGDLGCVYPDDTYCRDTGCYNLDGTSDIPQGIMWENETNFDECMDSSGNIIDREDECPDDVEAILGNDCHDMETGAWFNGEMTQYIEYEDFDNVVYSCSENWLEGCSDDGGPGTEPPTELPSDYCFIEEEGEEDCNVCYNENDDEVSRECWWVGGGDQNKADKNDAQRQKNDMLDSIKNSKRDIEKEYPKFKKEIERFLNKDVTKKIGRYEKLIKRAGDSEGAVEILNDAIAWTETRQEQLTTLIGEVDGLITSCTQGVDKVEAKVNSIVPGEASWDELNAGWSSMRKYIESCWPQRNSIDFPYRAIEQEYREFSDMKFEIAKAVIEMESYDISIPSFIDDFFTETEELGAWVDTAFECNATLKGYIQTLRSTTDPEDIDYAQQDVWDAEQDCNWGRDDMYDAFDDWRQGDSYDTPDPWQRYVDRAWKTMDDKRYVEEDKRELEKIRGSIEGLANIRNEVKTDDQFILKHIQNLEDLKAKALPIVNEMISAADKGEYVEWEKLELIGKVADKSMEVIARYCEEFYDRCSLSPEVEEMIYNSGGGYDDGPGNEHPPGTYDGFGEIYFDEELVDRIVNQIVSKLEQQIVAAFTDAFTRLFTETMADKIATQMEGQAGEVLSNVFNNIENLGDDRTKQIAENSTSLYDVLDKFEDEDMEPDEAAVVNDWHGAIISTNLKGKVITKFEELLTAVRNGSDTASIVADLRGKYEENDKLLATEDKVQFLDAKIKDNDWYYGSFMGSSFTGDSDSEGRLTGFVRPAGLINRCEALKIAIEAAGLSKADGASDWWCSAYEATAEREEFNMVGRYGDSAYWVVPSTDRGYLSGNPNRAEICRLFIQAGNLEYSRYDNEFPDVDYLDPWAEDAATCKRYGIITGQGNGNFDPHSPANRAEVAAMEVRFREAIQADQLFSSL